MFIPETGEYVDKVITETTASDAASNHKKCKVRIAGEHKIYTEAFHGRIRRHERVRLVRYEEYHNHPGQFKKIERWVAPSTPVEILK